VYTFAGPYMPGMLAHQGVSLDGVVNHQWITTEGVFGVALGVSTSFVFLFVLFELPSARRRKARDVTPPPPLPREPKGPPAFTTWLAFGALTSSDAEAPVGAVSVGARVPFAPIFGLELAVTSSLGWLDVRAEVGDAEVDMVTATLHAIVDPWACAPVSASFGVGGGVAWAAELGQPRPGFANYYDSTLVGLISARLGVTLRHGHLSLVAFVEPGIMVPAVTLRPRRPRGPTGTRRRPRSRRWSRRWPARCPRPSRARRWT
jgi:hypothetical protein